MPVLADPAPLTVPADATVAQARELAEQQMAAYPQYAGHFAGYTLGTARVRITTAASGLVAETGERVLVAPQPSTVPAPVFRRIWSGRCAIDVSVFACEIDLDDQTGEAR